MTTHERFRQVFSFGKPNRLPAIEWATWWDKTIDRWLGEGLRENPRYAGDPGDVGNIAAALGLDVQRQVWIGSHGRGVPAPAHHGAAVVSDTASYHAMLPHLYPADAVDERKVEACVRERDRGDAIFWISLDGFFWHPRTLLGIQDHLFAFYDQPELMKEMNERLAEFHLNVIDRVCHIGVPDFMTFAEDLSYNNGPMLSGDCFREFLTPYYQMVVPELKKRGIRVIVDSDGDVTQAIPWFMEAGVEGILPLERQAGVDIAVLQERFPGFLFVGGFDKMVMPKGEAAIRAEFERLLPAMRRGGFIPSVDHQTPPDVSLDNYRIYARLLLEYCGKATA